MLHPVVIPSAAFTALLRIYDKLSRLKIVVLQSSADIFIAIKVDLRFISKLSQNRKQPFQTSKKCWPFDAVAVIFASYDLDFA